MYHFSSKQRYECSLSSTALLHHLQLMIASRPTGWRWYLGLRRPPCWVTLSPASQTLTARVPHARSNGPFVHGYWQENSTGSASPPGTVLHLTIRLPLGEVVLGGLFALLIIGGMWLVSKATDALIIPAATGSFFTLMMGVNVRYSIRYAERYFQQALPFSKIAS